MVDSRDAALRESGDILIPIGEKSISADHIYAELGDVIAGTKPVPYDPARVTLFKSLGLAIEDVVSAALAYRRAETAGRGTQVHQ